jgi:hypothetical protein
VVDQNHKDDASTVHQRFADRYMNGVTV